MEKDKHLLDIEDLGGILSKLKLAPKANGKWQEFGLGLGLLYTTIENIEADEKGIESCFRACLAGWLRRADNVDEKGLPTLSRLAEVLEEIGDKATAEKLMKENKGHQFQNLILEDVEETSKELGHGYYGVVIEVIVSGTKCAAKKIRSTLIENDDEGRVHMLEKFEQEILLHSNQRHPNIVQLIGVYYPSDSKTIPTLIMEYLPFSLLNCLRKQELELKVKYPILHDVARGLRYLHGKRPPIVHRDLTANNVLLTLSYTAKISDLGVSRLADTFNKQPLSTAPGTQYAMPPEALKDNPVYNHKLDVFSYGCLILHVLTNKVPLPSDQFIPKPGDSTGVFIQVSEWERRSKYIKMIPTKNEFLPLAKKCLNEPEGRPEMSELEPEAAMFASGPYPISPTPKQFIGAQSVDSEGGHTARPWNDNDEESSTSDPPYVSASEGCRDTDSVDSDSDGKDSSPPRKKEKGLKREQSWWERFRQPSKLVLPRLSRYSSDDTEDYRNGYPGKRDNPRLDQNYKFYTNEIPSYPQGNYIDMIHEQWWGNYEMLEHNPSYIQWLFPIRERGLNWHAQELQLHEAKLICSDEAAKARVVLSYKMMLDFYGLELKDEETGEVARSERWEDRFYNLNHSEHNCLRLTRILKCLGELELEHYKPPLIRTLLHEAIIEGKLRNTLNTCVNYWIPVVKDDKERKELMKLAQMLVDRVNKK